MKYFLYLLVLIFSFHSAISQNETVQPINSLEAYNEYFKMPRESLYLHLNKSSYLRGESIWFQGYAYDRKTQNLNPETRNIEVGVYNDEGNIIDKKLFLAKNGLYTGQITIDSTYADGNYYLKAETNYMKNFKEDYAHVQQFEVLGEEQIPQRQTIAKYDLQILPEGGYNVVNCKNHLGLKLTNTNGLGVKFEAKLFEGETGIIDFKSNQFGHAKVEYLPKKGKSYQILAKLPNGDTIRKQVEGIKLYGYALNINTLITDKTIVQISSNLEENHYYKGDDVRLMVHQEGKEFIIPLYFSEHINTISKVITDKQLFVGVNTFTLLVNGKPIAERLVFNKKNIINKEEDLIVKKVKRTIKDSLLINLSLAKTDRLANVSISVLPEKTISYLKNQNISSAFLLEPFVNGYVENKSYYFKNTNRKVDYDLDLLMLTQGWSKYEWDNILRNTPKPFYKRLDGLSLGIGLNDKPNKRINKLLIFKTAFNEAEVLEIQSDSVNQFKLQKRYPIIGEEIEFTYIDKKKSYSKADILLNNFFRLDKSNLDKGHLSPPISALRDVKLELKNNVLYSNFRQVETLDTVFIHKKVNKKERLRNNYILDYADKVVKVDEEFATIYFLLADYLQVKGFLVQENFLAADRTKRFNIVNMSRTSLNGSRSPAIFLDGVKLYDFAILAGSRMSDYEEVYVDRSGYNAGMLGPNGIIRLETRRTPIFTGANGDYKDGLPYQKYKIVEGFQPSIEFYTPKYKFFKTESFQQVGVIAWFSDITIEAGKPIELKIFDTGLDKITLHIEGIAEDGSLINIEKTFEQ